MTGPVKHIRLHATTTADGRGLLELRDDLRQAAAGADGLDDSMARTERTAAALEDQIGQTKLRIRELGEEFAVTKDRSLFGELGRERSHLRQLERILAEMADGAVEIGSDVGDEIIEGASRSIRMRGRTALYGAIGVIVVGLAPVIGAAIAGAVTGAVGVGGVIGGVAAAAKDPRVREAARSAGQDISSQFFSSGDAFVQPVIDSLGILRQGFRDLDLESTFGKAAPFVTDLAEGIAGFAREFNQGFNAVLDRSGEIIPVVADGLIRLGDGLGSMIEQMAESEGTIEGIRFLFEFTAQTAHVLGVTVKWLGDRFHELGNFSGNLSGALEDIAAAMPFIGEDNIFSRINDHIEAVTGSGDNLEQTLHKVSGGFAIAHGQVANSLKTWDDYDKKIREANDALKDSIATALSLDNANLGLQQSMLDLRESIKDNGRHWETNTEKGLANRRALLDAVAAAERKRQADIDSGKSADTANAAYQRTIDRLKEIARKAGISEDALRDLVGDYNIDVHIKVHGQLPRIRYRNTHLEGEVFPNNRGRGFASGGTTPAFEPFRVHDGETLWSSREHFVATKSQTQGVERGTGGQVRVIVEDRTTGGVRARAIEEGIARGIPQATLEAAYP